MKIAQKYSHLNGEEYLIVHHNKLYKEIKEVITNIDADKLRIKIIKEKRKIGNSLLSPIELNETFNKEFYNRKWGESRYHYYITQNRELMEFYSLHLNNINSLFRDLKFPRLQDSATLIAQLKNINPTCKI